MSRTLRSRSAVMPTLSNSSSDVRTGPIAKIGGLEICHASTVAGGRDTGAISNRVAGSVLHQPSNRGQVGSPRCRSCTNAPASAPGPEFRYLYEHQAAKSTSQSCSAQRHVAGRVRQVPADDRARAPGPPR